MSQHDLPVPPTVSEAEWFAAVERLRADEKDLTRRSAELAARRRRLPALRIARADTYEFEGPAGPCSLADLFEGRSQLIVHHFMFAEDVCGWPEAGCDGCSMLSDGIVNLAHLHARDASYALVSRAPYARIEAYRRRMGWKLPWYSSAGSDFNRDFGVTGDGGETYAMSVFLRSGTDIYRTYVTGGRGVEYLGSVWSLLDLLPYGRQETWEDSPPGWPQSAPFAWWRRHDEYA